MVPDFRNETFASIITVTDQAQPFVLIRHVGFGEGDSASPVGALVGKRSAILILKGRKGHKIWDFSAAIFIKSSRLYYAIISSICLMLQFAFVFHPPKPQVSMTIQLRNP